eukprot:gene7509-15367_t
MEPQLILKKRCKLRSTSGHIISFTIQVLEFDNPYTLIVGLKSESIFQMKITNDSLASEMKAWLEGKRIENPALVLPNKIEEIMMTFVKFGKPPSQQDLIAWILSRSEILWTQRPKIVFGGLGSENCSNSTMAASISNPFPNTVEAASSLIQDRNTISTSTRSNTRQRPSSAPITGRPKQSIYDIDRTFTMTNEILGKSAALEKLQQNKVKGRTEAKTTYVSNNWTDDHFRLTFDINRNRRAIEKSIEERRKSIEIATARQVHAMNKFKKIRDKLNKSRGDNIWFNEASHEVELLNRIQGDVEDDVLKQRVRAERAKEHVRWTMAPNGFANRRGKSMRGPYLGAGALPADATTELVDPRLEHTVKHYYWDQYGRRHRRRPEDIEQGSAVEQAMDAIRKAAKKASAYKLDLHSVFRDIDTSNDGFLDINELNEGLINLGLKLDPNMLYTLFRHFDPNDSGAIHYGEFIFSFFNRRSFIKQFKKATNGKSKSQILEIFYTHDRNGDGSLSKKELFKVLKDLKYDISDTDLEILIRKFDLNGDGELDIDEFMEFIQKELDSSVSNSFSNSVSNSVTGPATATALQSSDAMAVEGVASYNALSQSQSTILDRRRSADVFMEENRNMNGSNNGSRGIDVSASSGTFSSPYKGKGNSQSQSQQLERTEDLYEGFLREASISQFKTERLLGKKYY